MISLLASRGRRLVLVTGLLVAALGLHGTSQWRTFAKAWCVEPMRQCPRNAVDYLRSTGSIRHEAAIEYAASSIKSL